MSWPDLPQPKEKQRFFTFFVCWYDSWQGECLEPELVRYIGEARPEVVQFGKFGPMFHSFAHDEGATGGHLRLPMAGDYEKAFQRQVELLQKIREAHPEVRIVSHTEMSSLEKEPFIKWFNEKWDEDVMGPRPDTSAEDMLMRDGQGNILTWRNGRVARLCISNPHVREIMKKTVEIAVKTAGVDGLITNYNYLSGCVCEWCRKKFGKYLRDRYDDAQLREKFGIDDINNHVFMEIPANLPGYPDVETATELDWAAAEWGARHFKEIFDEIIIEHGRSLNPDLIVATWDHRPFTHSCERAFRPIEKWHRGENYFWYSGGRPREDPNAAWVHLLWLREMAEGKPFMLGKYEHIRIRRSLAEGLAAGGSGTGLRHYFEDEYAARIMTEHHRFVHKNRELYAKARPRCEVGVVLPRMSTLNRRPDAFETIRALAPKLAEERMLFEFVLDERLSRKRLDAYDVLALPSVLSLSDRQVDMIREYVHDGGAALIVGNFATLTETGERRDGMPAFREALENPGEIRRFNSGRVVSVDIGHVDETAAWINRLASERPLSRIQGPSELLTAAYDIPGGLALHLVNAKRDADAAGRRNRAEWPVPATLISVELNLPAGAEVDSVILRSPDHVYYDRAELAVRLEYEVRDNRLHVTIPQVDVYAILHVKFSQGDIK